MEFAAKIRFSDEIQGAKIEKADAEAKAKVEAEMKGKVDNTRKSRAEKAKADAETV